MIGRTIPTLQEIVAKDGNWQIADADAELAAVLIVHNRRLDALEQQARPYQEDGELAVDRVDANQRIASLTLRAEAAEREAGVWKERIVAQGALLRSVLVATRTERDAARATVERLSAALRAVYRDERTPHAIRVIVGTALDPFPDAADALKETPDAGK
jgi:hypothetical protein